MLGLEAERAYAYAHVLRGDRIVAARAGGEAVAPRRHEKCVIGGILQVVVVPFFGCSAGQELVEDVVRPLFVG